MNTLYKTWNLWDLDQREDMLEDIKGALEENNLDASDEKVLEEAIEVVNEVFWQDFIDNTIFAKGLLDKSCIISGTLGRWDGNHEIVPEEASNLLDAITRIISSGDCEDYSIYEDEDGNLLISTHHYDGVNDFKITYTNGEPINWKKQVWE